MNGLVVFNRVFGLMLVRCRESVDQVSGGLQMVKKLRARSLETIPTKAYDTSTVSLAEFPHELPFKQANCVFLHFHKQSRHWPE